MNVDARLDTLLQRLQRLAAETDEVELAWAGATTPEAIDTVESALGVRIAGSLRDFLLRTGGGGLDVFPISSLPADDPLGGLGTLYGDTRHYREIEWATPLPPHLLVIQRCPDDNEPFCLDTSQLREGEHSVVLYGFKGGHVQRIAPSFIDFLERWLEPHFENAR